MIQGLVQRSPIILKQNSAFSSLLNIIFDYLNYRKQKFIFNGQYSTLVIVKAGEYLKIPCLDDCYISDFSDGVAFNPKLFPDDTHFSWQ